MNNTMEMKCITKNDLCEMMMKGRRVQLVNVLEPKQHDLGVIKGSHRIPLSELEKRCCDLDKAAEVVTYCADSSCSKSRQAAQILGAKGFKVCCYEGGVTEWKASGLPMD